MDRHLIQKIHDLSTGVLMTLAGSESAEEERIRQGLLEQLWRSCQEFDGMMSRGLKDAVMAFKTMLLFGMLLFASTVYAGSWQPTLTGTIDRSNLVHGQTTHITYNSPDATGAAYNIVQWADWIGWADGVSIPTSGVLQITPAMPGTFVVTIAVAKRRFNLNRDLATVEGHRRTATLSFPITVTAPGGKPENAWDGKSAFFGELKFNPSKIRLGEEVQRTWTSGGPRGFRTYIDGQEVTPAGSDMLTPQESLTSVLQVTSGRRWKWVYIQRASVEVVP